MVTYRRLNAMNKRVGLYHGSQREAAVGCKRLYLKKHRSSLGSGALKSPESVGGNGISPLQDK